MSPLETYTDRVPVCHPPSDLHRLEMSMKFGKTKGEKKKSFFFFK